MPDGAREGVPGVWDDGWAGRGYTGVLPSPSQVPIFSIYLASGPTYGQMKAKLDSFMRFLRLGLERVPE